MQVPCIEGHDLLEGELKDPGEEDGRFLSLQRRSMLLYDTVTHVNSDPKNTVEEEDNKDFYDNDEDNDSFITINTSEDENSDDALDNSESNDSGVVETMFEAPQRSYGINPIFAKQFLSSALDNNTVAVKEEFKYVKNSKLKTSASKDRSKSIPKKISSLDNKKSVIKMEPKISKNLSVSAFEGVTVLLQEEQWSYNESCLI